MEFLVTIMPWVQVVLSIILVTAILLQQTGAGVGGAFGGGDDSIHYTRRGLEKVLFYLSIVIAILFALSAFAVLLLRA
ncbi:MAG: preprotein translocase subunit SecG [bacterium]|nr:preprotein translocase subunit SecG [bacterium]